MNLIAAIGCLVVVAVALLGGLCWCLFRPNKKG